MCREKVRYEGKKSARKALQSCQKSRRPQQRAYQCDECYGWHLTSERHKQHNRTGRHT